jgi:hypothetical protein
MKIEAQRTPRSKVEGVLILVVMIAGRVGFAFWLFRQALNFIGNFQTRQSAVEHRGEWLTSDSRRGYCSAVVDSGDNNVGLPCAMDLL